MLLHEQNALAAADEKQCAGYWFQAAKGRDNYVGQAEFYTRNAEAMGKGIERIETALTVSEHLTDAEINCLLDSAQSAFSSQLDIASALVFEGFESWVTLLHADKIERHDDALD